MTNEDNGLLPVALDYPHYSSLQTPQLPLLVIRTRRWRPKKQQQQAPPPQQQRVPPPPDYRRGGRGGGGGGDDARGRDWGRDNRGNDSRPRGRDWGRDNRGNDGPGGDGGRRSQSSGRRGRR
mmetsp:Transcript_27791/g.61852  ORF Transcript_27791/g.61852 Transcript_27791/m.61852 type:complete len:122 (-) Transcript_27791:18-383(-)